MKILDANNIHQEKIESDVCIIGAGPAGIVLAMKLRNSGLNVVIAESGGVKKSDRANHLNSLEIKSNFSYREGDSERNRQLGGTANLWTGRVVPFVFDEILDEEWKGLKEKVEPFYDDAFTVLGIDPEIQNKDEHKKSELYAYWAHKTERFNYNSELLDKNENVRIYCNLTCIGDPVFENGMIHEHIFKNRNNDFVKIESKCFVFAMGTVENVRMLLMIREKLVRNLRDKIKNTGRFMMDHPRIWHGDVMRLSERSSISRYQIKREKRGLYKTGIRNKPGSSRVYCNLMRRRSRVNSLIDFIPSESYQYSFRKLLAREKGILKASFNEILKWPLISESNGLNQSLENFFNRDPDRIFDLMTYFEQRPWEENHIRLRKENDRNGLPIPSLENNLHQGELKEAANFYAFLESYLRDLNCQVNYDLEYLTNPANYTDAAHLMGGTRYSNQPERSVLEKDLSVKGIPNLHITGSSAFPTSGVENPTHLIVSLSCYLAEVLKRKFE